MKRHWARWLGLLLLLAFFAQGMAHIRSASLTFDEGPHLAVGYTTLRTGDFRLQPVHIHPPLANVLAAFPLLLQNDLPDPRTIDGWDIASLSAITDAVVWRYPHPERLALAGRMPILGLAILLGALIARWARDLGGARAGLLALALYAFDPNMIAHGTLITTDMAATFLMAATLYAAQRTIRGKANAYLRGRESAQAASAGLAERQYAGDSLGWAGVGVLLGMALLAKVSALILAPLLGLMVLLHEGWGSGEGRAAESEAPSMRGQSQVAHGALRILRYAAAIALPAALVLGAGYGFEIGEVAGLPFPIPAATHLQIYQSLQEHYALGHPTFLLGEVSSHGWWWYFPVAFALKTPSAVLLLALYALVRAALSALRRFFTHSLHPFRLPPYASGNGRAVLWLFPLLYAASSFVSTVNIGYRHLLPLLPFLYIALAHSTVRGGCRLRFTHASRLAHRVSAIAACALLLWLILSTLAIAPDYLAFFNEIAGGPENGYRALVDSNLDWGQNLWQLRDWMAEHRASHVFYAHYSPARPQAYGINADFLPPDPRAVAFTPWRPAPGLYVIGATVLQGPYAPDANFYAWFRSREPAERLGHALFLYQVEAEEAPAWAVLCAEAGLAPETVRANLGLPTLRVIQPDCAAAEVYPQGMGLRVSAAAPAVGTLDFTLTAASGTPGASVYRQAAAPAPTHPYPMSTQGPLDFVGYDVLTLPEAAGTGLEVHAYWRVKERPERPLSLMAHLVAPDGSTAGVGDGMCFPIDQWQEGDLLIQRHTLLSTLGVLSTPGVLGSTPGGGYALRFGGYWLDTMERWAIEDGRDYWEVKP